MSKYRMEDGTVIDTTKASASWKEDKEWGGNNYISKVTGSQWNHQELFRSRKGRYYIKHYSDWQGSRPHAEWVSEQEATRWLTLNGHELPEDLKKFEEEVTE